VSVAAKVNENRLLEEEELSFYRVRCSRCGVVDDDVVEVDADIVDAADRSRGRRGRRVDVIESQPRSEATLLSSPRALS
jgi:hypothetical protein